MHYCEQSFCQWMRILHNIKWLSKKASLKAQEKHLTVRTEFSIQLLYSGGNSWKIVEN